MCPVGYPVHVIQRGNNRQTLFTSDADIAAYAHWLEDGAIRFRVDVHGWVFMTNHVHLLVTPVTSCTNTGLVLGTEKFRDQVAALRS